MKKLTFFISIILTSVYSVHGQKEFKYPSAPKDSAVDVYFNEEIKDPYQWMEDPSDPRLILWLEDQDKFTNKISNGHSRIWQLRSQISAMYAGVRREKVDGYKKRDKEYLSKYVFDRKIRNDKKSHNLLYKLRGAGNYNILMKAKDYINDKDDKIDYTTINVNEDKDLALVTISINGSDWNTGYIFDLKTQQKLPYVLQNLKGSNTSWVENTLYYDAYDAPTEGRALLDKAKGQKLFKIEIGTDSLPELIYTNPDPSGINPFSFSVQNNKLFLYHYLNVRNTTYKAISFADLDAPNFFTQNFLIYPNNKSIYMNIEHIAGDSVWLNTNWNAPNGKVLLANLNAFNKLTEFVSQYDIVLKNINPLGKNKLALIYSKNGQNIVLVYNYQGELLKRIDFPKGKKVRYFYEKEDIPQTTFAISSFYHPSLHYQISLDNLEYEPIESLTVPYDVEELETRYITYPSKDGTEVSMYITCKKDVKLNGKNPVMLYGYGGYGNTVEPFYNQSNALFIAHGGILAVPNVRGGGAKGSNWALDGRRLNKQNAIDDFIGAAEYLINEKYTENNRLMASGSSHGGLLVTAAMVQRPELFKAVIAEAGPYDMLRFNKYTIGGVSLNINEFGTPENEKDFQNLKSYSPLHNINRNTQYPNLLLLTGGSDDRVPPFHSYKFIAALQEKASTKSLYTLYVTSGAGHGGSLTQRDFEDKLLFKYYFIFDNLDIDFY